LVELYGCESRIKKENIGRDKDGTIEVMKLEMVSQLGEEGLRDWEVLEKNLPNGDLWIGVKVKKEVEECTL
jgi:hypothetical protein